MITPPNLSLLFIMLCFWAVFFVVSSQIVKPLGRVLDEREALSRGARQRLDGGAQRPAGGHGTQREGARRGERRGDPGAGVHASRRRGDPPRPSGCRQGALAADACPPGPGPGSGQRRGAGPGCAPTPSNWPGSWPVVSWEGGCAREESRRMLAACACGGLSLLGLMAAAARLCIRRRGRARDRLGPPAARSGRSSTSCSSSASWAGSCASRWGSSSRAAGRPSPTSSPRPTRQREEAERLQARDGEPGSRRCETEIVDPARAPAAARASARRQALRAAGRGRGGSAAGPARPGGGAARRGGPHPARPRGGRDRGRAWPASCCARELSPADRDRIFRAPWSGCSETGGRGMSRRIARPYAAALFEVLEKQGTPVLRQAEGRARRGGRGAAPGPRLPASLRGSLRAPAEQAASSSPRSRKAARPAPRDDRACSLRHDRARAAAVPAGGGGRASAP